SISCINNNYTPIDFSVSCVDPNALPSCDVTLIEPENGAVNVNENTELSWNAASGFVIGYKLSIGLTPGGTEVLDSEDVGNVLSYDPETFEYDTTYYVSIVPYNDNGDAEDCLEESFTIRANPNQIVNCDDGALNTTYCYDNFDTTEFNFQSSDGLPLTIIFNSGGIETNFDEVYVVDSDGTILNLDLPYGNGGDFTGLTYTSSGSSLSVRFDTDVSISCASGSSCCTDQFDFDVFCASSVGFIQVNAFVDSNTNSVFDANESNFSHGYFTYEVNGDGMINTVNSSTGSFQIISANETDVYDITFNLYDESEACYDVTTSVFSDISVATGSTVTVDFPVVEEQSCEDLAVYLINNWIPPRPGFVHDNYLYFENLGFTTIPSGTVEFTLDAQLEFDSVFSVNPAFTINTTATGFTVDFVDLQPGQVEAIGISILCPVEVALGDIVTNTATYLTDSNDLVASNNYSTLSEVVVGSWDPNDKMESHGPRVLYDDFSTSDEWLYYTIRFQNLGTADAIFVRIEDTLDDQLDASTFEMLRASHDYVVTRTGSDLEWFFDDIFLPAEQDDAEGSIGFVYFRIKPVPGYGVGDVIPNTAAIYFDFNAPVITNRFETEFIEESLSVAEFDRSGFNMYPNPVNGLLNISLVQITDAEIDIIDIQGKRIFNKMINGRDQIELDVSQLQGGIYFVRVTSQGKTFIKKLVKE
ncbi:MAG: T9SS type A sorting domain-containing protein, partial [Psychroserpens sp.]|nr:T9SS type A sorting domain-containing protein [Psychroserpens sp.]